MKQLLKHPLFIFGNLFYLFILLGFILYTHPNKMVFGKYSWHYFEVLLFARFVAALQFCLYISAPEIERFIFNLLAPQSDARLFEVVAYAILKFYYYDQKVYFGYEIDKLNQENLKLYKTGRTNANDGGIDYVMKPLGRLCQVTETMDVKKYFLDIDKIEKCPLTFVIKSTEDVEKLYERLRGSRKTIYNNSYCRKLYGEY